MKKTGHIHTYVIISVIILLCAAATWFVPAGEYVPDASGAVSYERVDSSPQMLQVFTALYDGFVKQAGIIVFILIVGGAFQVLNATGAVTEGISKFIGSVGSHGTLVLVCLTVLFSLMGAVFGMSEETVPFVGIVVPLVVAMGYDAIVGMLVVYVAANIGFSGAFLNPFTVGIAQEMSSLPLFSGMGYRIFCWALLTALLVIFILVYARKVKKEPAACGNAAPSGPLGVRNIIILSILGMSVIALILGVTCLKWYMAEISGLFLVMGILCGAAGGFRAGKIADEFIAGAKDILSAALVVGLASGIIVILEDGHIIDTMLHSMQEGLSDKGSLLSLSAMYGIQAVINMAVPSATAKAAITIPIMAPFSDMVGISRQATVLAFQFGDGFTNMITPTSGVLIASLGMAKIQYTDWVKWAWKMVLALLVIGFIMLIPTVCISLSGF